MFKSIINYINQGKICKMKFPKAKLIVIQYVISLTKNCYSGANYFFE